jgi:hypothetical protein
MSKYLKFSAYFTGVLILGIGVAAISMDLVAEGLTTIALAIAFITTFHVFSKS